MKSGTRVKRVVGVALLLMAGTLGQLSGQTTPTSAQTTGSFWEVRSIYTRALGIASPVGLAFSRKANAFLVAGAANNGNSNFIVMSPYQDPMGGRQTAAGVDPLNLTFSERANTYLFMNSAGGQLRRLQAGPGGIARGQMAQSVDISALGLQQARGMTIDPQSGALFVLDASAQRIVQLTPDTQENLAVGAAAQSGRVSTVDLKRLNSNQLHGIAFNPSNAHLYVLDLRGPQLFEMTVTGELVSTYNLAELRLASPQTMVFAPSGDLTDDPATQSLYIADSGANGVGGRIVEVALSAAPMATAAATASVSVVRVTQTSQWAPPSPDPTGVLYWPATGNLLVADSEVDETKLFQGVNLFEANLNGNLVNTYSTMSFSNEPTDVGLNSDTGDLFFPDDNTRKVYIVNVGPDGKPGTGDDKLTSFNTRPFNSTDPEGAAYAGGRLYVLDALNNQIYVVDPGPNGIFDGVPTQGDDTVTSFDTSVFGLRTPEGIAYNPDTGTLFVIGKKSPLVEITTSGALVNTYDVSSLNLIIPDGLGFGPASNDPTVNHLYLVDRGVDNNTQPGENDGRLFELALGGPPGHANLLVNGDFELDGNGDGLPDNWSTWANFTRSADIAQSGSFSGKFAATDNSGKTVKQVVKNVSAGTTYNFSGYVDIPSTSDAFSFKLQVTWVNSAGSAIGTDTIKTYSGATTGWDQASAALLAPSGAVRAQVKMVVSSLNAIIYVDNFSFGQ